MLYRGALVLNEESRLVHEFHTMKNLKKLGFDFSSDDLTEFDALAYNVISDELAKIEREEIKKAEQKRKRR